MGFYFTHKIDDRIKSLIHVDKIDANKAALTIIRGVESLTSGDIVDIILALCQGISASLVEPKEEEFAQFTMKLNEGEKLEPIYHALYEVAQNLNYQRLTYTRGEECWKLSESLGGFITGARGRRDKLEFMICTDAPFHILQKFLEESVDQKGPIELLHDEFGFCEGLRGLFLGDDILLQDFD